MKSTLGGLLAAQKSVSGLGMVSSLARTRPEARCSHSSHGQGCSPFPGWLQGAARLFPPALPVKQGLLGRFRMLALLVKKENRRGENGNSQGDFSVLHSGFSTRVGGCSCSLLSEGFGCPRAPRGKRGKWEGIVCSEIPAARSHSQGSDSVQLSLHTILGTKLRLVWGTEEGTALQRAWKPQTQTVGS